MKTVKLGDVIDISSSRRVLKSQWKSEGVPFYRGREITRLSKTGVADNELYITEKLYEDFSSKSGVPKAGDIMVTAIGTIGNTYIVKQTDKFYFKDASVLWLKLRSENTNSRYIDYWFSSSHFFEQLEQNGTTVNTLTIRSLQNVSITLPSSEEQKRTVEILDGAFEKIDQAIALSQKNLRNTKDLFKSILNRQFNNQEIEEIPLSRVCSLHKKTYNPARKLPFVGMENIESGTGNYIGPQGPKSMRARTFEFNSRHLLYGRLRPYLNKVMLPEFDGHCSTEIFPIEVDEDRLDREYLFFWFIQESTVDKISSFSTGTRMPRANMDRVLEMKLLVPNMEDQSKIVKELKNTKAACQKLQKLYQQKIYNLKALKQSMLEEAFAGGSGV